NRPDSHARFPQRARFRLGRVQGPAVDATRLESSTSSTHSSERRQNDRFGLSARRISAPGFRTGYAGDQPSRKSMQAQYPMTGKTSIGRPLRRRRPHFASTRDCLLGLGVFVLIGGQASAFTAYVSNEKSNTISVIDTNKFTVAKTIKVGQRPRGIEL